MKPLTESVPGSECMALDGYEPGSERRAEQTLKTVIPLPYDN